MPLHQTAPPPPAQTYIGEADIHQGLQLTMDRGHGFEEGERILGHIENFVIFLPLYWISNVSRL